MHDFRFREFGLKTPIYTLKIGILGICTALNYDNRPQ